MSDAKNLTRPNIILFVTEKQRADSCSCYGQNFATTPVLDEMASQGVKFNKAFSAFAAPVAMKANLLTGLEIDQTKCFTNLSLLPQNVRTLAHVAHDQGYDTAFIGNWQLGSNNQNELKDSVKPENRGGFNSFWRGAHDINLTSSLKKGGYVYDELGNKVEFEGYRSDCITDMALDFLQKCDKSKPFFMTICQGEAHQKTKEEQDHDLQLIEEEVEKEFAKKVVEKKLVSIPEKNDLKINLRFHAMEKYTIYDTADEELSKKYSGDFAPFDIQVFSTGTRRDIPCYLSQVTKLDENLGKLIEKLKADGIYDNTVIVFTSLSGNHFNCRNKDKHFNGFDDGARTAHTNSSHVPLVIGGGAIKEHKEIYELVSLESVAKTLATLMGQDSTEQYLGENLLALGTEPNLDKAIYYRISESRVGRAIRTNDLLYSVVAPELNGTEHYVADHYIDDNMYDLNNDIVECNNVAISYFFKEQKLKLRERLIDLIAEHDHLKVTIEDAPRDKVEEEDRGGEGYREDEEVNKEQIEMAKRELMIEAKKRIKAHEQAQAEAKAKAEAEAAAASDEAKA